MGREGFVILVQVGDVRELIVKRLPDPIPWPGCGPFEPGQRRQMGGDARPKAAITAAGVKWSSRRPHILALHGR
jgi:hypothetical protein